MKGRDFPSSLSGCLYICGYDSRLQNKSHMEEKKTNTQKTRVSTSISIVSKQMKIAVFLSCKFIKDPSVKIVAILVQDGEYNYFLLLF